MSSNPFRKVFGRRPRVPLATAEQRAALTDAFFGCERVMGDIVPAMGAAHAVGGGAVPAAEWDSLRDRYDRVISQYLTLTTGPDEQATAAAVDQCLREFGEVSAALNRFATGYRTVLNAGRAAITGAAVAENQARVSATRALGLLDQAAPEYAGLSSVRSAADELGRRLTAFENSAGLLDRRRTGEAVVEAAQHLENQLGRAPGLAADVDRTLRSLDTRCQAVNTRLESLPSIMSQLLRDFSADCSNDLTAAPAEVAEALRAAGELLARAKELRGRAPDEAYDLAERARTELNRADETLDRVVTRLNDLREVRRDPAAAIARVRFRVRDAQSFALGHNLVRDWGSVLDAQAARIDRAATTLQRIHPDYWSYLSQLRAVDARITEIIGRMREQVANRGASH